MLGQVNADAFGATVVAAMGHPADFLEWQSLRSALHFAASWSCEDLKYGELGPLEKVSPETFATHTCSIADEIIGRCDNLSDFGWGSRPLKTTFAEIVGAMFARCKTGERKPAEIAETI